MTPIWIGGCWGWDGGLLLELKNERKKLFAFWKNGAISWLLEKPKGAILTQGLVALVRKYQPRILKRRWITQDSEVWDMGHLWLEAGKGLQETRLILGNEILCRQSSKGTFTHKKHLDPSWYTKWEEIDPCEKLHFSQQLSSWQFQVQEPKNKDERRRIHRRWKTVRKAWEKLKSMEDFQPIRDKATQAFDQGHYKTAHELFQKSKRLQRGALAWNEQKEKNLRELKILEKALETADAKDMAEALKILPSQKSNNSNKKSIKNNLWRIILLPCKTQIWIGKNAANNDLLVKKSLSSDLWFHLVQGTGSHVIIPKKFLQLEEKKAMRYGSILALHFSSQRNERCGEVYCGLKSSLKKGKKPGEWLPFKAKTLWTSYEEDEIKNLLKDLCQESFS